MKKGWIKGDEPLTVCDFYCQIEVDNSLLEGDSTCISIEPLRLHWNFYEISYFLF